MKLGPFTTTQTFQLTPCPRRVAAACLLSLGLALTPGLLRAEPHTLSAPHPELHAIPLPNLEPFEAAVRDQLATAQADLEALLGQAEIGSLELSLAYGQLGQLYQAYELSAPAALCYRNAQLLAPQEFRWIYLLGHLQRQLGELAAAATSFEQVLHLMPDHLPTLVQLAEVRLGLGQPAAAEPLFRRALEVDPTSTAARAGLGQVALAQSDYQNAVQLLTAALAEAPAATRLHYPLALAYRGLGDTDKARQHLAARGDVGIKTNDPLLAEVEALKAGERPHLLRGRTAFAAGRYAEAAEAFRAAVRAAPNSAGARVNLGTALAHSGDVPGAIAELERALELEPQNPTAHFNLGLLQANQGQLDAALPHLTLAARQAPTDVAVHLELAALLRRVGQPQNALAHYLNALLVDPTSEAAHLGEAAVLVDLALFRTARERLEEAYARLPHEGRLAHALARLLAGCPDLSLRDGQRALELAERVFAAQQSLGHAATVALALAELGRCTEAANWQQNALAAARQAARQDLVDDLQKSLDLYASGPPCRPR